MAFSPSMKNLILTTLFLFCTFGLLRAGTDPATQPLLITSQQQASLLPPSQDSLRHRSASTTEGTIPALLIGDIHFDPFHDPAKVQQLVDTPVSGWSSILAAPPSPNQQPAFAALQQTCPARGVDTPYALLQSSLQAMRSRQPDAKFITVTGDLIAIPSSAATQNSFPDRRRVTIRPSC
jgi:hypothetical protein